MLQTFSQYKIGRDLDLSREDLACLQSSLKPAWCWYTVATDVELEVDITLDGVT